MYTAPDYHGTALAYFNYTLYSFDLGRVVGYFSVKVVRPGFAEAKRCREDEVHVFIL